MKKKKNFKYFYNDYKNTMNVYDILLIVILFKYKIRNSNDVIGGSIGTNYNN